MRSLQASAVMFSPHWPAACRGEKSVQRRWQQSPHRPCSRGGNGPHNPRSTQTPPRRKEGGAWELWRLVPARCLLSAHSFPVGCKATLTLIVMLWRGVSDWGTLKTLFSPVECWGTPLEWRFFTAWPASFVSVCDAKLFKRQVRYKKTHISRILRHREDKLTDYCVTQRVSGLYWSLNGLIIT